MPFQLVFLDAATLGDADITQLQQPDCHLTLHDYTDAADIVPRLQHADIAIINKCVLDAASLQQLPRLKAIMVTATGTDNVDIVAANNAGIVVKNVQNYAETAVPQQVFALLLALTNQLIQYHQAVQTGVWSKSKNFCLLDYPIMELAGKTLVIIGYGALGQKTAALANAFGMNVIISERPDAAHARTGRVLFRTALAQADVVSLHCPLTTNTFHLLDAERMSWLKPGAIIINTARGALIEPNALITALHSGQVRAAGLDVLAQEPPPANDILLNSKHPNLLITPHTGWASQEARKRMVHKIAVNIHNFIADRTDN
ncbi:D-2-hydroxyacid dehydrogenase [Alishewanella tabrizica]|uniref:Glycerate dehydrogenase n=1 Tax=Alishewanella tabrizica TaxID=671278 RepID=A0ABQ2WH12_9ALTE|nr:D-2-hydroxyacid dehydrogenase [Alishewanella tabrizica]GGW55899.1 glycerate dehydrogenase [Alishewanella tabrizica]